MARIVKNRTGAKTVTFKGKGLSGVITNPSVTPLSNDGTCLLKFRLSMDSFDIGSQTILNGKIKLYFRKLGLTPISGIEIEFDKKNSVWTDGGFYEFNSTFKLNKKNAEMIADGTNLITDTDQGTALSFKIIIESDSFQQGYGVDDISSEVFTGTYIYRPSVRLGASLPNSKNIQQMIREEHYFSPAYLNTVGRISMRIGYDTDEYYRNWKGRFKMSPYLTINYIDELGVERIATVTKFYSRIYTGIDAYTETPYENGVDFVYFDQTPISGSDITCDKNCSINDSKTRWIFKTNEAEGTHSPGVPINWSTNTSANTEIKVNIHPTIIDI